MKFENVTVEIVKSRWDIRIMITHPNGDEETYVASADGGYTYNDGIWFGTLKQWEDEW